MFWALLLTTFLYNPATFTVPSGITPPLDTYTGAAGAYSTRKLRTAYSGSCIRVRRTSDSTETDIGFSSSGALNGTALTSHCTGTNCFVTTWYDQSGNSRNATQTTTARQPKIYDSSTGLYTRGTNSRAVLYYEPSVMSFLTLAAWGGGTSQSLYMVYEDDSTSGYVAPVGTTYSAGGTYHGYITNAQLFDVVNTLAVTRLGENRKNASDIGDGLSTARPTTLSLLTCISNGSVGAAHTLKTIGSDDYVITDRTVDGYVGEVIIYLSASSSGDKTGLESNINSYWSLY